MRRRTFAEYGFVALAGMFLATAAVQFDALWEDRFPRILTTGTSILASLVACFTCFYMATVSSRAEPRGKRWARR